MPSEPFACLAKASKGLLTLDISISTRRILINILRGKALTIKSNLSNDDTARLTSSSGVAIRRLWDLWPISIFAVGLLSYCSMTKVEMAALVWTFEMVDDEMVTEGTSLTLYTHLSRNSR
jgi:hypothetical protein